VIGPEGPVAFGIAKGFAPLINRRHSTGTRRQNVTPDGPEKMPFSICTSLKAIHDNTLEGKVQAPYFSKLSTVNPLADPNTNSIVRVAKTELQTARALQNSETILLGIKH